MQLVCITPAIEKNDVTMNVHLKQAANHVTWGLEAIPILHSLACLLVFEKKIALCLEALFFHMQSVSSRLPHLVHLPHKNPQGFLQQLQEVSQLNYECN